jgi:hypothetical protein
VKVLASRGRVRKCCFASKVFYSPFGLLLLMLQKKIELFCTEWIPMFSLSFTVSSLFGFYQLHFMAVIIDAPVFIWTLNLLRLIHHDQILYFERLPTFALKF